MKKQFYVLSFLLLGGALTLTNNFHVQDSFGHSSYSVETNEEEEIEERDEDCAETLEHKEGLIENWCDSNPHFSM